jgi:hypothetical protein
MIEQYSGYLAVGAIVLGGSSIIAWVSFFLKMGQQLAAATEAKAVAVNLESQFNSFRVEVAKEYATSHELAEAEGRTSAQFESLRLEIRTLNDRILQVISSRG